MKPKCKAAVTSASRKPVIRFRRAEARAILPPRSAVLTDVRDLILAARQSLAHAVNVVAEYRTDLLMRTVLIAKRHNALRLAWVRLENAG